MKPNRFSDQVNGAVSKVIAVELGIAELVGSDSEIAFIPVDDGTSGELVKLSEVGVG